MQSPQSNINNSQRSRPLGLALALCLFTALPALAQPTVVGHSFTNDVLVGLVYVTVNFNVAVDPTTATDPANYQLGGGATVANGLLDASGQNVSFEVANVFGGDPYTLNVSGVQDLSAITMVATNLTGNLPPIRSSYPGGTMSYSSTYGFPIDNARDGVVSSGNFFITGGVGGDWWQLDLGAPVPIGELDVWFRYNCCNQRSANVQFTIMDGASNVLWTAFKGPDYVPNGPWLNNTNLVVFPEVMGQIVRIAHPVGNSDTLELSEVAVLGPSSGLCITAQPVSQTVLPGKPVTFSVAFSGLNQPITFQWKHEGTNIPGATSPTLSIPSAGPADAGLYSVVVADSTSRQRTSASALLSLLIETVPPTVAGQVFTFNRFKDELKLGVKFSEQVDPVTATNPANYLVVGAGTLTNGVLHADGQGVTFNAVGAAVGCANYTLNVSGVRDLAGNLMVPTNLAGLLPAIQHSYPGGTVTASSAYDLVGFGPPKARDGDLTATFITGYSGAIQEYWELDLGAPASIGELDIWFRYDCCTDNNSFLDFTIMDAARTPLWTNAIGADILPLGIPTNFYVSPPVMGQIVRVAKADGNLGAINLGEVLVLETGSGPCTIAPTPGTRVQDSGSNQLLVLEAEHFSQNLPAADASWVYAPTPSALKTTDANITVSGTGVMEALPNGGVNRGTDASTGPRLDYNVSFTSTGTFYAYVRGVGDSGGANANDSVFIGIDGTATSAWTGFPQNAGYAWATANAAGLTNPIVVTTTGPHVINVWMREDGFAFDKLVLSSNPTLNPTGVGPAESKTGGLPSITINRTPGGLTLTWEGTATLQSSTNVAGQYNDVVGAASPYPVTPTGKQQYYRTRQ